MAENLTPDESAFLENAPADGSSIGNRSLRQALGWDEARYDAVREALLEKGVIAKGRGRGGAVKRVADGGEAAAGAGAPERSAEPRESSAGTRAPGELFSDEEVYRDELFGRREEGSTGGTASKAESSGRQRGARRDLGGAVATYEYAEDKRKNLPPAGLGVQGKVEETEKVKYAYDPHLPPVLRYDETGATDELTVRAWALLEKAKQEPLDEEETAFLAQALRARQPWLEWATKRERELFEVDPVALHIHERVSAKAILATARREEAQRDFFADPQLDYERASQFYRHDVDWTNRLILGDSLQVMTSLARREGLAGQVQMVYIDPPYGIKFSSNWQNEVGKRDVKDKDEDLTREPEMIKAYRDTWTLGVHSYLDYLKQRLILTRELLTDSGSVFVQISDENLHRVRAVMDEVFGVENFVALITFKKTGYQASSLMPANCDYLIWYSKSLLDLKYRKVSTSKLTTSAFIGQDLWYEEDDGHQRRISDEEAKDLDSLNPNCLFRHKLAESSGSSGRDESVNVNGRLFRPKEGKHFSSNDEGMKRLLLANRFFPVGNTLRYKNFLGDYSISPLTTNWVDTVVSGFSDPQRYVVQTSLLVIQRCLLMTTDPGDLVLDPTCGSGTTAYVAEQWGRRWITVDTSRVAVAIARQRLLTATYPTFKTKDDVAGVDPNAPQNPKYGFIYKTVPHITLKSIAQNKSLDPIFQKHEGVLLEKLRVLNDKLGKILAEGKGQSLREKLAGKLLAKCRDGSYRDLTEADKRRWILPGTDPEWFRPQKGVLTTKQAADLREFAAKFQDGGGDAGVRGWKEWEVPFDTDPDWPEALREALTEYRRAWRAKMDEVNACIEANAEQEELVDQPEEVRNVVRVSGPFTVESIRPLEDHLLSDASEEIPSPIGGAPEELDETFDDAGAEEPYAPERDPVNLGGHIERMLSLLRSDGVTFPGNRHIAFERLDPIESSFLHAEGEYRNGRDGDEIRRAAVVIGPEHGAVTKLQTEEAIDLAQARRFDAVIFAGFSFDDSAQAFLQEHNDKREGRLNKGWKPEEAGPLAHMALIRPDVLMGDLLKGNKGRKKAATRQASQQIFTVFGQPRTKLEKADSGKAEAEEATLYRLHMEGMDVYDPVTNRIEATSAKKVAAWFLDTDYDGKTFCVCQAFFPDAGAWDKLKRALKGTVDEEAFAAFSGTTSLPFPSGKHGKAAVKVIDPRGNEVMRVVHLEG